MSTIKEVAQLAGVSTATVSRIINGKGEASPETINKVLKIVQELNYRPNSVAKSLSKRQSDLIALLIPNLDNPFFSELVKAIEKSANEQGYQIYLCNSEDNREKVEYYLEAMKDNYVAGAIINSLYVTEADLDTLEASGIATITIDRAQFLHPYSAVSIDHVTGGYLAAKHLIDTEKSKKLLFLSGPEQEKSSQDRYQGYLRAISENNVEHVGKLYGDFDISSGYQLVYDFLAKDKSIDGIVSSNDAMALGALRACKDLAVRVPEDIGIVGYDNISYGKYAIPRLTTVDQFKTKIGQTIMKELIDVSQRKKSPKKYEIKPEIVTRDSTIKRS